MRAYRPTPLFVRKTPTNIYRPSFLKHLHNLVINGFWARDLDADDHEFLEYVKLRGIANGDVPMASMPSLEELEFWHFPYTVSPGVERKAGPVPVRERPPETAEQREQRLARSSRWYAQRAIRRHEKAIADAELVRETAAWEAAKENRKLREQVSDAEWEAADPKNKPGAMKLKKVQPPKPKFGKVVGRHYVPLWKLEELGELGEQGEQEAAKKRSAEKARKALERRKRDKERELDEEDRRDAELREQRIREHELAAEHAAKEESERRLAQKLQAESAKRAAEYERETELAQKLQAESRKLAIEEARRTVDRVNRLEREWNSPESRLPNVNVLKRDLLLVIKSNAPRISTFEELMRATGCFDKDFVMKCLNEMVEEHQLKRVVG